MEVLMRKFFVLVVTLLSLSLPAFAQSTSSVESIPSPVYLGFSADAGPSEYSVKPAANYSLGFLAEYIYGSTSLGLRVESSKTGGYVLQKVGYPVIITKSDPIIGNLILRPFLGAQFNVFFKESTPSTISTSNCGCETATRASSTTGFCGWSLQPSLGLDLLYRDTGVLLGVSLGVSASFLSGIDFNSFDLPDFSLLDTYLFFVSFHFAWGVASGK